MAKKRLAAIVKIQIPAGQATPAPPVGTALGPHGINIMDFCKAYNAGDREPARAGDPGGDLDLRGPSFTFVTKTPPTPFLLRQAAGIEKGSANPRTEKAGRSPRAGAPDRRDQDARPQRHRPRRRDAPGRRHRPVDGHRHRGLSSSLHEDAGRRTSPPEPDRRGSSDKESEAWPSTARSTPTRRAVRPRPALRAAEALELVKSFATPQVRRDGRGDVPPRRRPPQGRPDDPRHRSLPHGTGKEVRVTVFAQGDQAREAEEAGADSSVPTTSSPGSRAASSTSTSRSPPPTSWARSASSVARSARAA